MFSNVIKSVEREYEIKRNQAEKQFEVQKQQIYKQIPRLTEIDSEIVKCGISASKAILIANKETRTVHIHELETKIQQLKKEKNELLSRYHLTLKPHYECEKCHDSGYITTNQGTQMCNCFKQKLIDLSYNKSNLVNLKKENFDTFDCSLYSDQINIQKYGFEISPRENIEMIRDLAFEFVENFDNPNQKNLLFCGTSGLGKTFLSNCISNEILKKGYTVLYQTSPILLDTIFNYKFNKDNSKSNEIYQSLFTTNLLVIDDLGTENLTAAKYSELFTIINSRLLTPYTKTIISTNLSLQNLFNTYDNRIVSRIIGNYNTCIFFGEDIRLKRA